MIELLKMWPAILSVISLVCSVGVGGYILYVRYWLLKEVKEPIAELKEHSSELSSRLSGIETQTRNDIKALEASLSDFKVNILTSNAALVDSFKNTVSEKIDDVTRDLTNLWKTKVDQTSLDSKITAIDSKIREVDNKVSQNQSQVIDYLLKHRGE